ncbi:DciA family protein [Candidatus Omnitrophota bacterium]
MESIRNTTQRLISELRHQGRACQEGAVLNNLRQFFTPQEQKHITNCFVQKGQVVLHLDSSAWLYQLNLKKEMLLKHLNQTLEPKRAIQGILLRLERNETKKQNKNRHNKIQA